jgi:hypothetical protein
MSAEDRTPTDRDWHTEELPPTPQRDFLIASQRWVEAPQYLHDLGTDFGVSLVAYKRRIGRYLLWRAGPAVGADARYCAILASDVSVHFELRLHADKRATGIGPDGHVHDRFRAWKQALLADANGS